MAANPTEPARSLAALLATRSLTLLVGALLLVLGRKLYWFFVAAAGFAAGLILATRVFHVHQEALAIAIALGAGLLGALLAYLLQHAAIVVAGILAGALAAHGLAPSLGVTGGGGLLVMLVVGAILGAVLMHWLFDWGLILLSSLVGAALLVDGLRLDGTAKSLVGVILVIAGIAVQASVKSRKTRSPRRD